MWIQSHQEIAGHPKTKRVMRLLGISRPTAIGYLHMLWWWAMDHADDGDLSRYDSADIEDAVEWDGQPGAFVDALCKAGYLDGSPSDGLIIHDWHEYGGRLEKKNRQAAQRMRNMRARNEDVTRNTRVTDANVTPLDQIKIEKEKEKGGEDGRASRSEAYKAFERITGRTINPASADEIDELCAIKGIEEFERALRLSVTNNANYPLKYARQVLLNEGNPPTKNGKQEAPSFAELLGLPAGHPARFDA